MTRPAISQAMIELYDRFTHGDGSASRRDLITGLARLTGGVAAATAILPLLEARAEAKSLVAATDDRIDAQRIVWGLGGDRLMVGYIAQPRGNAERAPKVMVIHENRGLNEHIKDVTRRLAVAGFVALAPDFLTAQGETPRTGDGQYSAEDVARALIAQIPAGETVRDAEASLKWFDSYSAGRGVPGAVGFCWGGGVVNELSVAAGSKLRAGVSYYGAPPRDLDKVRQIKAKMLLHYAGLDTRINALAAPYEKALQAAGVDFKAYVYPGVNHAFNNDTSEARYDKAAATLAWQRTLAWLK
jgi:carboxymethylenebutenolidase